MSDSRPTCDLEAYAARYVGRGRILRLRFIASKSAELELDALQLAINAAKDGRDTAVYKELVALADNRLGPKYALDEDWVATTDRVAATELDAMRCEHEEHREQQNREVIRAGLNDLGDFFYVRGSLNNARGQYITMRDYCTHTTHHLDMCMKVILVSMEAGEFHQVENYVHVAENTPELTQSSRPELAKMRSCAGVALLVRGKYKEAAVRLLSMAADLTEERIAEAQAVFNDVFCLEDIATYAGLCALATMDRYEFKSRALGCAEVRQMLELVPLIRDLMMDFHAARYTSCLRLLDLMRADLMLDPYLGIDGHVDKLYRMIRCKALVQYIKPFESVDIVRMAAVFKTDISSFEKELIELIEDGEIDARIDMQHQTLHRKNRDPRRDALERAVQSGMDAFDEAEVILLRMNLSKHRLVVTNPISPPRTAQVVVRDSILHSSDMLFDNQLRPEGS